MILSPEDRVQSWQRWGRHPLVLSMLAVSIISAILDLLDTENVVMVLNLFGGSLYLSWLLIVAPMVVLIGTFTKGAIESCLLELAGWIPIALMFIVVVNQRITQTDAWYEVGSGIWLNVAIVVGAVVRVVQLGMIALSWTEGGQRFLNREMQ